MEPPHAVNKMAAVIDFINLMQSPKLARQVDPELLDPLPKSPLNKTLNLQVKNINVETFNKQSNLIEANLHSKQSI